MDLMTTATSKDEQRRGSRIAVLPVGSFEQHGAHLPLITDTVVASLIAGEIAAAYELWLLPPITVSCSHEHSAWAGTVSLRTSTLIQVIDDIAESARRNGADRLVLVNGHGGNYVLSNVTQEANTSTPTRALFPGRHDWENARLAAGMETSNSEDMHGGELEVSLLLHAAPDLVGDDYKSADHQADYRPHLLTLGMRAYTESGIIGRPSAATPEKGRALLESLTKDFESHLRALTG